MYSVMKKLILSLNAKRDAGQISDTAYESKAEAYKKKIEIYLAYDSITVEEAEELLGMLEGK